MSGRGTDSRPGVSAPGEVGARFAQATDPVRELLARRLTGSHGHELLAGTLKALGIDVVYGITGLPVHRAFAACAHAGMRPIGVRHQQAAVFMSLAHNYVAGQLRSAVLLSKGPAITNAATGVLVARDNGWPLVVLGGRAPLSMQGQGSFQELDGARLLEPIAKWTGVVGSAEELPKMIERGCVIAMRGRPGPVYLDIAEEALLGQVSGNPPDVVEAPREASPVPDATTVDAAARLLAAAERPLVIVGKGLRWSSSVDGFRRLVEGQQVPFISSPMGRGFLPDDHLLCVTAARGAAQAQADVVLVVGARLDWTFRYGTELAPSARLIQIDIEPTEIGRNRPAVVGVVADAGAFLDALAARLAGFAVPTSRARWRATLEAARRKEIDLREARAASNLNPIRIERLMRAVRTIAPPGATIVLDGNLTLAAGDALLPAQSPATRLTPGSNGCMGVGVPFGIGAALAEPGRGTIVVTGDFAFGIGAMELETAVRNRVPLVVVVANNGRPGSVSGNLRALYPVSHPDRVVDFQLGLRYDQLATALGAHGELVESVTELEPALRRAFAAGRTSVVNVLLDPER